MDVRAADPVVQQSGHVIESVVLRGQIVSSEGWLDAWRIRLRCPQGGQMVDAIETTAVAELLTLNGLMCPRCRLELEPIAATTKLA